jgi:hypothetical protein
MKRDFIEQIMNLIKTVKYKESSKNDTIGRAS